MKTTRVSILAPSGYGVRGMDMGRKPGQKERNRYTGWLCLLLLLGCSDLVAAQAASPQAEFKRAKNAYVYGNYGDAIRRFRQLLYPLPGRLRSPSLRREAHKYLGISYYYLYLRTRQKKFRRSTERELTLYLLRSPNTRLDPLLYPPNLIDFFNRIRLKNKRRLEELLRKRRQRRNAVPIQVVRLYMEKHVFRYSPWLAMIPFGTPQFIARQPEKGGLLLGGQVLALGINITAYFVILNKQIKDDKFNLGRFKEADIPAVIGWQIAQGVSIGVFGVLVVIGMIDGVIQMNKRRVTLLPKLPPINKKKLSLPTLPLRPSFSIPAR